MFLLVRISPRADIILRKDCNSHPLAQIEDFEKHKRSFTQKSRCRGRSDRVSVRPATNSLYGGETFDERPSTDVPHSAAESGGLPLVGLANLGMLPDSVI